MDTTAIAGRIETLLWSWHETKLFLEHSVAFSSDALQVIASVVVLFLVGLVLRKPVTSWWPWTVVLGSTLINEVIDLWVEEWPDPGMQYGESAKDLMLTMFLPTLLLITSRKFPRLYQAVPPGC